MERFHDKNEHNQSDPEAWKDYDLMNALLYIQGKLNEGHIGGKRMESLLALRALFEFEVKSRILEELETENVSKVHRIDDGDNAIGAQIRLEFDGDGQPGSV